jgi:molybdopterin molybdotransferase
MGRSFITTSITPGLGNNVRVADDLISVDEARRLVLRAAGRMDREAVTVDRALGRALAEDVLAGGEVPPFPCSAMDGYAVTAGPAGRVLTVAGESRAGLPTTRRLGADEAIRISTGAAVPVGGEAVIRQEDVTVRDGQIETAAAVGEAENVRAAGEDMHQGELILRAGTVLTAVEIGAAVAAGAADLIVAARPRLSVLCTGDELRAPGERLAPGEIHNSNGPMLTALANRCGAVAGPARRIPDDRAVTEAALAVALEQADVVVVSGGVSVGPHDHVKPALEALGVREVFWRVALQPGKPTWFGTRGRQLVFGLPGNPVSAVVTFTLFARAALAAMQGADETPATEREAVLGVAVARNRDREQAIRVRLQHDGGVAVAIPNGPQGSHIVTSLVGADALAMIPAGTGELAAGTRVILEPLVH